MTCTLVSAGAQSQTQGKAPGKAAPAGVQARSTPQPNAPFTIELANELGVKATVNVATFSSGNSEMQVENFIDEELNEIGGRWDPGADETTRDFSHSRLVIEMSPPRQFVLIPWQSFKALSAQDGAQLVRLNDGTEYKGLLKTILSENWGNDRKVYELGGALSMTIVQMPKISVSPAQTRTSKDPQWRVTGGGGSDLIVTRPRFVYSWFHQTSGGGMFVAHGHDETKVSEQFGVGVNGSSRSTAATISDFESISIAGGGNDAFARGMPVTVKAKGADAVSGILAVTPFGLEPGSSDYRNRSLEVAGDLANGCTIVFSVRSDGDKLTLERIHTADQRQ
jgi:hypothetical protein